MESRESFAAVMAAAVEGEEAGMMFYCSSGMIFRWFDIGTGRDF